MVVYKKSEHQMSEIEQNAFEEHCRASETYKTVVDTKWIKVKGYDNSKPFQEDCYACATQRHACEHDGRDDSEDLPEWWNEV